jgi:type IV pilus assembly protein PilC
MLRGIIGDSQHSGDLRRQFVSALAYPLLLLACLILLVVMFAWWLVPTFREIFMDFGTELPAATMLVLGFSETIRESRGLVFVIPLLLLAGGIAAFQFRPRSSFWDWTLHRVPVLGATLRLADGARFTRHLANLVEAEVPVADALRISGRDTNQASLRREVNELATEIELGDSSLRESLPEHRILPKTVVHVLSLKTKHQAAVQILRELSWMYEQQTRNRLDWFASVFGPVSVLFLGAVIGFYIIALFLPLIFLIQNLT